MGAYLNAMAALGLENVQALQPKEQQLIDALRTAFGATTGATDWHAA